MIYIWCMALTIWLTCTAGLLIDTRQRLAAAEKELADLKIRGQILRRRVNYIEYGETSTTSTK